MLNKKCSIFGLALSFIVQIQENNAKCFENVSILTIFSIGLDNFSILILSWYVLVSQIGQITDYTMSDTGQDRGP